MTELKTTETIESPKGAMSQTRERQAHVIILNRAGYFLMICPQEGSVWEVGVVDSSGEKSYKKTATDAVARQAGLLIEERELRKGFTRRYPDGLEAMIFELITDKQGTIPKGSHIEWVAPQTAYNEILAETRQVGTTLRTWQAYVGRYMPQLKKGGK